MSRTLAMIATAIGIVGFTAGSASAGGGCGSTTTAQSVSLDTQTRTQTASSEVALPSTPKPADSSD